MNSATPNIEVSKKKGRLRMFSPVLEYDENFLANDTQYASEDTFDQKKLQEKDTKQGVVKDDDILRNSLEDHIDKKLIDSKKQLQTGQ